VTGLGVVSVALGAVVGAVLARSTRLQTGPATVAAVLGLAAAAGTSWVVPLPAASLVISIGFVLSAMAWHWRRQPAAAHRVAGHLDRRSMVAVAGAELASAWPLMVAAVVAALGVTVALAAPGTLVPAIGMALAAVPVLPMVRPSPASDAGPGVVVPSESVTLVEDPSSDRQLAAALATRSGSRAVACHPPHLFRGLGGWNLGLGLDAEQAAWAGQLARMLGLGGALAEPAPVLDARQAKMLTVCRAVATGDDPVILDEPAAGLDPAHVRDLARVVRVGIGDRRLIVVTSDPAGHRSFVSRAQTRS
jgi:hypothetical protein